MLGSVYHLFDVHTCGLNERVDPTPILKGVVSENKILKSHSLHQLRRGTRHFCLLMLLSIFKSETLEPIHESGSKGSIWNDAYNQEQLDPLMIDAVRRPILFYFYVIKRASDVSA
ncbi:uncharacterized protein SOCG_02686 [Schizosaccharomyces octosporus yFS286]|uniref:Uncharacterized protein n=1 Tax=Schizosaccharomyces octosporus (strain yFS286) TaxID=483514 RepID=S9PZS4_SCHOY|nr:uncharacterized protein SOCG_02686 [Schizosaccharomyces octosporus yFS286]EPX73462.1 hypothetical protein SOCG_02686 [Schizosaccharomyces octosporus yFS286]